MIQKAQGRKQILRPMMQEIPRIPKFKKQRMMVKAQGLIQTYNKMIQRTQMISSKRKQTVQLKQQSWIQIQKRRGTKALLRLTTPRLKNHVQVYCSVNG